MIAATIVIFLVLAAVLTGLHFVARELTEYEGMFVHFSWVTVVLVISVAVYLAYAAPSFAQQGSRSAAVMVQDSNLLQE